MVLAQKQKYRSMEQDRKARDKPTHLMFGKGGQNKQWRKDSLFNNGAGKTEQLHVKE